MSNLKNALFNSKNSNGLKKMAIIFMLAITIAVTSLIPAGISVLAASSAPTVADGVYTFSNCASGLMVNAISGRDVNGNRITTWVFDGTIDQRFRVKHIGNGKYLLYAMCSSNGTNRVIDILRYSSPVTTGQKVDLWSPNDSVAQQFYINPQGDGSFTFEIASLPGNVIGCTNAWANGAQLQLQKFSDSSTQKWFFNDINGNRVDPLIPNDTSVNSSNSKLAWPVDMSRAMITNTFAGHTYTSDKGIDIGSYGGIKIPVYAAAPGKVIVSSFGAYGEGNYIKIDHGNGKITIYEHLNSRGVAVGQTVAQGQEIGIMGCTGNSTGVHLHFGLVVNGTKVDPAPYLQ